MRGILAAVSMAVLLALAVSAQDLQEFNVGKYSVSGKGLQNTSEGVKIGADDATLISWKAGKDDVCKEDECLLSMKGFECLLSGNGQCRGVSKGSILMVVDQSTEQADFGMNTKLLYDLVKQEFTVLDKKFAFGGKEVSSNSQVTVMGNKIVGDGFIWGDFQASAMDGQLAELTVDSDGLLAGKGTVLKYDNMEFAGRNADYQICFDEKLCNNKRSYVFMDPDTKNFHAAGKLDGGPKIVFFNGNPFLGSQFSESARFEVNNLENSDFRITQRKGKIPYVDLKVYSDKDSARNPSYPPVELTNGQTTVLAFANDVWITNKDLSAISSQTPATKEQQRTLAEATKYKDVPDSVPMFLGVIGGSGNDLLGAATDSGKKLVFSAYNSLGLANRGDVNAVSDEKLSGMPPSSISEMVTYDGEEYPPTMIKEWLGAKLPNLKGVEGFNKADVKRLIGIFNDMPTPLTSNLKNIRFVTDEEAKYALCEVNCAAWIDKKGNMFVKKQGINTATIKHELVHVNQEVAQRVNPGISALRDDYERTIIEYSELQDKINPDEAINPGNIAAIKALDDKAEATWAKRDKAYVEVPLIKEWMAANYDATMRKNPTEYCNKYVVHTDEGTMWADGATDPRHGVLRPYGCMNVQEDMATSVEDLDLLASQVSCEKGQPNVYAKKIFLLNKHGWIDRIRYEMLLPQPTRDCIGMAMR